MIMQEERIMDNFSEKELDSKARKYFTIAQVAELYQVSPRTIKQMVKNKEIGCFYIGKQIRFNEEHLKLYEATSTVPTNQKSKVK